MRETKEPPEFFHDLNLDQVVDAITSGWDEFDLKPFFYRSLRDLDTITYRQGVMRDLEGKNAMEAIESFTERIRIMRRYLKHSQDLRYKEQKEGWFIASVNLYCEAIEQLSHDLNGLPLASRGLQSLREFLASYVRSSAFEELAAKTKRLTDALSAIRYCLIIKGNRITVRNYDGEEDYSAIAEETFQKFRRGA
ncbi:MAG TPA: DNA mismatch repair protein MutS, partial [Candidatus Acetothermia bacterium]|nr:DNA mismatch repair protein MutS [Candidatus Acetothermia bacterium]